MAQSRHSDQITISVLRSNYPLLRYEPKLVVPIRALMMNRKTMAMIYVPIGTVITTIFVIMIIILSTEPIQSVQWIGWAFVGLAIGVITLFVAAELCRKKVKTTIFNWDVTKPIISDIWVAIAFSLLISLLIRAVYEEEYRTQLYETFGTPIILAFAITHYLLHRLAEKLENQS